MMASLFNPACRTLAVAIAMAVVTTPLVVHAQNEEAQQEDAQNEAPQNEPAENGGLSDLDEAMAKKLDAESLEDLEQVATLLESALAKGLDEENQSFARKMLGGVSLQRGQAAVAQMMRGRGQAQQLRTEALRHLETAVENDPTLVDAHLLIARLSTLPGGNPKRALEAATAAVENLADDPTKQSEAYVLRAVLQDAEEQRLADLDKAIEVDPNNAEAYQARALVRLQSGDPEGAVKDLRTLLEKDPANTAAAVAASEALMQLDRTEDAMAIVNDAITTQPSAALYMLRAELRRAEGQNEEALSDLDRALAMEPKNPAALLLRAETRYRTDDLDGAKADIDAAMALQPGSARGIYLRSLIAAQQERFADAINDMKLLSQAQPDSDIWSLQLGNLYQLDQRPRRAIEVASAILEKDPGNWQARRLRGDAYLSINEHAKAIDDYEAALEQKAASEEEAEEDPEAMTSTARSGLLNNLAWVLATSPQDELRSGQRSIELATEAAELSEFKEPHILSTLAAAYAEAGDFEKAIEWASKAVELGKEQDHDQIDQLQKELDSYREGKPWREAQEVDEKEVPILAPEEIIDA